MSDHASESSGVHLRLVWPQWQGAGTESVRSLAPKFSFQVARRLFGRHEGPAGRAARARRSDGIGAGRDGRARLDLRDGIEAKSIVLEQLEAALSIMRDHRPDRITTLGGECSVSIAPFSYLDRLRAGRAPP